MDASDIPRSGGVRAPDLAADGGDTKPFESGTVPRLKTGPGPSGGVRLPLGPLPCPLTPLCTDDPSITGLSGVPVDGGVRAPPIPPMYGGV